MTKSIEEILVEVYAWAEETFPDTTLDDLARKLAEEYSELSEAFSEFQAPWSSLDGPFSPERAAQVGKVRRNDLLDEVADNVIVLARLTHALGADLREVVSNKWDIVKSRDYRQLEPKEVSTDDRSLIPSINASKKDRVIVWNSGRGFYLVQPSDGSLGHWTAAAKYATRFSVAEADEILRRGELVDGSGKTYRIADVGAIVVGPLP